MANVSHLLSLLSFLSKSNLQRDGTIVWNINLSLRSLVTGSRLSVTALWVPFTMLVMIIVLYITNDRAFKQNFFSFITKGCHVTNGKANILQRDVVINAGS